jgi:hypothetical protein
MKESDATGAESALRSVLGSVVIRYDVEDLPLVKAADNLKLAEFELHAGNDEAAQTALNAASDALKQYEKTAGETRSLEVKTLQTEIDGVANNLVRHHDDAQQKVSHWWDRVVAWFHK